jgi:hypothetical protein
VSIRAEDVAGLDLSDVAETERIGSWSPATCCARNSWRLSAYIGACPGPRPRRPSKRITEIVAGERTITAETAISLGERFGTTAEFWLNLQTAHDLETARRRLHQAA